MSKSLAGLRVLLETRIAAMFSFRSAIVSWTLLSLLSLGFVATAPAQSLQTPKRTEATPAAPQQRVTTFKSPILKHAMEKQNAHQQAGSVPGAPDFNPVFLTVPPMYPATTSGSEADAIALGDFNRDGNQDV